MSNLSTQTDNFDKDRLFITNSYVNEGPTLKRFKPAAMGRAMPIRKRTSHLVITLSDNNKE